MGRPLHDDRFADPGDTIYTLMADGVLVECPRCGRCASHKPIAKDIDKRDWFAPRRLVCSHCALVQDWNQNIISSLWHASPPREGYFKAILWIRGRFGSHDIWAYNWHHLGLIEQYVAAKHRLHVRDPEFGWASKSFVNRLPFWLVSAKNREDVLRVINRIKRERAIDRD